MGDPSAAESKAGVLRWDLIKIILMLILTTAGFGIGSILFPPFLNGLGYPISTIGVLISVQSIAALLSRLPAGVLYRPGQAIFLLRLCLILFAVTSALYPFAVDPLFLWPVRFMNGLFYGVATTVNFAMYMDAIPPQVARHRALALYAGGLAA
ncbi:MAG TPA: MFS transporter, partial [bacterium]|nr:MFS transporter [bacterium]